MKYKTSKKVWISLGIIMLLLLEPLSVLAYMGSMGYEGGIAAADPFESNTYSYREICFLSGVPVVLEGNLTVKKSVRKEKISTTYTYQLENTEQDAALTRVIVIDTLTETKENGQTVESSEHSRRPTEIVRLGGNTYEMIDYRFTQSGITDPKPAVSYNAGEYTVKKTYRVGTNGIISLEMTGNQYGYDQYWSSAKAGHVNIILSAEIEIDGEIDSWGGMASVSVSNTAKKDFQYVENEPWQISFQGGYVERNWEESMMEYSATFPEFDQNGKSTEVMHPYQERIGIDSEPMNKRLMVPDLKHLEGHWAEEPVKILFSLEVLPGSGENFNPAKYINRRDFTAMIVRAIKEIPQDPDQVTRTTTIASRSRNQEASISPFVDMDVEDPFYEEIKKASACGIIQGTGQAYFSPDRHITTAEAVTMLIRAIGLEGLAPYPYATTPFVDNDKIPAYARNAAAVAYRINLVEGDSRGYFHPNENLTYERASALVYRLIQYMGDEIVTDYRERVLNY